MMVFAQVASDRIAYHPVTMLVVLLVCGVLAWAVLPHRNGGEEEALESDARRLEEALGKTRLSATDPAYWKRRVPLYRELLDNEARDVPELHELAFQAIVKHSLDDRREDLALFTYYLCGGVEGAKKRLRWMLDQEKLEPRCLRDAGEADEVLRSLRSGEEKE